MVDGGVEGHALKCEVEGVTVGVLVRACGGALGKVSPPQNTATESGHTVSANQGKARAALTAEGPRAGIEPGPSTTEGTAT